MAICQRSAFSASVTAKHPMNPLILDLPAIKDEESQPPSKAPLNVEAIACATTSFGSYCLRWQLVRAQTHTVIVADRR